MKANEERVLKSLLILSKCGEFGKDSFWFGLQAIVYFAIFALAQSELAFKYLSIKSIIGISVGFAILAATMLVFAVDSFIKSKWYYDETNKQSAEWERQKFLKENEEYAKLLR